MVVARRKAIGLLFLPLCLWPVATTEFPCEELITLQEQWALIEEAWAADWGMRD